MVAQFVLIEATIDRLPWKENTFVTVYLKMCIHVLNKLSYLRSPNIVLDIVHLLTIKEKVWPGGGGARH